LDVYDRSPWALIVGKSGTLTGTSMPKMWNASLALFLMFLIPHSARAQDSAEAAAVTSSSSGVAASVAKVSPAKLLDQAAAEAAAATSSSGVAASGAKAAPIRDINPQQQGSSTHLLARQGPLPDETNRKAFEESAGKDAGKLLMRSTPTGAQIFVNGRLVGRAPLLMILAPGKYKVEMRGQRQDYGQRTIGLLPNETQDIALTLSPLYPIRVSTR
jgi:hypothetical protein